MAEKVALFQGVSYPPEVSLLTELAWTKQGDAYVIPVGRERITVARRPVGRVVGAGRMNGQDVCISSQNLAGRNERRGQGHPRRRRRQDTAGAGVPLAKRWAKREADRAVPQDQVADSSRSHSRHGVRCSECPL